MAEDGTVVFLKAGDVVWMYLPSLEACVHMNVAGKAMGVQVLEAGSGSLVAQLLNRDGSRFSFPILLGEAGIYTAADGRLYVPKRWLAVPPPQRLRLFVPRPGSPLVTEIAPGSAIVGEETGEAEILVDYEGNVYRSQDLQRYWQRAYHAASRHLARYPTTARERVAREDLIPVGWWDVQRQEVTFDPGAQISELVGQWLGLVGATASDPAERRSHSQVAGDQLGGMETP